MRVGNDGHIHSAANDRKLQNALAVPMQVVVSERLDKNFKPGVGEEEIQEVDLEAKLQGVLKFYGLVEAIAKDVLDNSH